MAGCPAGCKPANMFGDGGKCPLLNAAYILAGLAMMLNIRLSYSSAPYALIRFGLPENLFSVFVRRMASSLELWCLPGFIIADVIELTVKLIIYIYKDSGYGNNNPASKELKFGVILCLSIVAQWLNFLTYVILFFVYRAGGDQGRLTTFYWIIAVSGFVFGISNPLVFAADYNYIPIYIVGENCFPALTSFMHYISTLMFGNRRKWNSDYLLVYIDILVAIIISFVAAIMWTAGYGYYPHTHAQIKSGSTSGKYTLTYTNGDPTTDLAGSTADSLTTLTHYGTTYSITKTDGTPLNTTEVSTTETPILIKYGHIHAEGFSGTGAKLSMIGPLLIVLVGMGLVYAIYPGIAPGMIVPFYLVDKIEMVLLIATIFPPVIVATLQLVILEYSPKTKYIYHGENNDKNGFGGWTHYISAHKDPSGKPIPSSSCKETAGGEEPDIHAWFWHFFDLIVPIMIILAYIFIYSLHYRDSKLSRSIVNQPKMSTALTILFYMCHETSLAVGFAGMVGNATEWTVLAQMIGAFLMVFLALYSEGYIIEYKSHDPHHWPTEGMTKWNAFCYWCKRASKITNHNLRSLFTTDLRRDLLLCIQKNNHLTCTYLTNSQLCELFRFTLIIVNDWIL